MIPTYQNRKLVNNTIRALDYLETTDDISYEAIIVDDGSLDDTFQSLISEEKQYPFFYVYLPRTADSSRARARNYGLKNVTGDIVVFIDGDIIVKPDYLLKLERYFEENSDIAVMGMRLLMNEPMNEQLIINKSIFDENVLSNYNTGIDFRRQIFDDISYNAASMNVPFLFALTCNLAVPKSWIDLVGGFDEDLKKWGIEDIEFVYRMYLKGLRLAINPKGMVIHQFHGQKEKNIVAENYIQEVDYNTSVFIKKHPGFMGLSDEKIYELFRSIVNNYKELEKDVTTHAFEITLKEKFRVEDVKEEILSYANDENTKISVYDYIEDSNLDVYLQLLKDMKAKILYYPRTINFLK